MTAAPLPRGRHHLSRDAVTSSQRARMLRAMAEAMAERGYVGTPVAEIIRRAGVSRETFYQQFASKQDCFAAALDDVLTRLAAMLRALPEQGTPLERFDRLVTGYLDALAREPATAGLFLVEVYAAGPEVMHRRVELQQQFVDGLVEIFGDRTARGRFACQALVAAVITMVTTHVSAGDTAGLRRLRAPLVDLVAQALQRR
jgi:AcrR family transcriptional regulator